MESNASNCQTKCLTVGLILGLGVLILLLLASSMSFLMSLVLGIVVAILATIVLRMVLCIDKSAIGATPVSDTTASSSAPVSPAQSPLPEPAPAPDLEPAPASEPETAADPDPAPAPEGAQRPAGLEAAREGGPDDLKKIRGVGPKLEEMLHSLGIYHYDQIAAWGPAEVAWMDANLKGFRGRVTRDGWVAQAGLLAAGGETDFSRKVDDGDIY